jgi:hypothetical protein
VEGTRHWLSQINAHARADFLTHEDPRHRELRQDVGDLRQALSNDPRFDLATSYPPRLTNRRRNECLEEFWTTIHQDPLNKFQDECQDPLNQVNV